MNLCEYGSPDRNKVSVGEPAERSSSLHSMMHSITVDLTNTKVRWTRSSLLNGWMDGWPLELFFFVILNVDV